MANSPNSIDTWGEFQDLFVYVVLFLVAGIILGAVAITANPRLDEHLRYTVMDQPDYSGGEIVLTRTQIDRINRVYTDSLEEFGWCLEVEGSRVMDMKHPLRLEESTETHITFACRHSNGIVHTHQGALAVPELCAVDGDSLLNSDLQVSCVVSDPVPTYTEQNPVMMNCFNRELAKMEISISEEDHG